MPFPNVVVLGVGHSGTSLLARMLLDFGYQINNMDTYLYEDSVFRDLNARLLGEVDFRVAGERAATFQDLEPDIVAFLASLDRPFILKDPRFVRLAHLWKDTLLAHDPRLSLIYITKDKKSVERSYVKRGELVDGTPGVLGKTVPELFDLAERQYSAWPGAKIEISYEMLKTAARRVKRRPGPKSAPSGLWF